MAFLAPGSQTIIPDGRRPAPVGSPPSRGEIKNLRERLSKYGKADERGLTDAASDFLATAVTAPAAVRAQLARANVRPTAAGDLEVIFATVPIDTLVPDPGNGRVVGATAWPAADSSAGQTLKLWTPSDVMVHPRSSCEVLVQSDTIEEFKTVLGDAAERTRQFNPRMKDKVERDGILDPLLCQLMHVQTTDGHSAIALVTRDGSTRCSFAQIAHGHDPHDALFGALRDAAVRRDRWQAMKRRFESPAAGISEHELIELRTYLVPVQIIIGFRSEEPNATVMDAIDEIVRRTHVETSWPWMQVAQSNSQADQILLTLKNHGMIDNDEFLMFGGKLTRADRVARHLPVEPDGVLATVLNALGAGRKGSVDEVHQVLRRATGIGRITSLFKANLAGALGLRQFPADNRLRSNANQTLEETLRWEPLWEQPWSNTDRTPEQLRDAALEELASVGDPGPACCELAAKASGWMAAQGWLKRELRTAGIERDQRAPNMVLDAMAAGEHGIRVLAEVLEAGRRGEDARALEADGTPIEQVSSDIMLLSNDWIRSTFGPGAIGTSPQGEQLPVAMTPREQVAAKMREVARMSSSLARIMAEADEVRDDSETPFLERNGWPESEMAPVAMRLSETAMRLQVLGALARSAAPTSAPTDQLELAAYDSAAQ